MKKIFYISLAVLMAATVLPSCNKKLKDDIEAMDKSVEDIKTKHTELEGQILTTTTNINTYEASLETSMPITWTIKAIDYNSATDIVEFNETFTAKLLVGSKNDYQYLEETVPGVWEVYIEKSEDFDYDYYAYIDLYVNTATNKLSETYTSSAYGSSFNPTYEGGTDFEFYAQTLNPTNYYLNPEKLDVNTTTGEVDILLNWEDRYGDTFGGFESGTIGFKGTCFVEAL